MDVRLQGPDPPGRTVDDEPEDTAESGTPSIPSEPFLYLARRNGDRATLIPVLRVDPRGPAPLPSEMSDPAYRERFREARMEPGTAFTLFTGGARVGTLSVDGPGEDGSGYCAPRPAASGRVELTPSAADVDLFLALARGEAAPGDAFPPGAPESLESTYQHRVASINMAAALIPEVGAAWPPSVRDARRELRVLAMEGAEDPVLAATFIHRDGLAVGPAPAAPSWSLFFLASDRGQGYQADYVWYRDYEREGKGAPRYLGHLDWNRDGSAEVLLEVLGAESRWFAAVGTEDGVMDLLHQEPCGRPDAQAGAGDG